MATPKWRISFKSLANRTCRVDIYDLTTPSYSGSTTELIGAADPIVIDEEDDSDLITVVRSQSGYLNIVETADTTAAIEALKPPTNTSRRVELYVDSVLTWAGYMQAQTFEQAWVPSPRQMSFPIMSPLALANDTDMPSYNPPSRQMLCKLLSDAIAQLNANGAAISSVVWPKESRLLSDQVNTLVVCPYNDDHDTTAQSPELMKPDTVLYTIEGICNCFGWMVHDAPGKLIFTKFDGDGQYLEATPANLATYTSVSTASFTGSTSLTMTDYLTPADAQGVESLLMPYEKVRLNYDGAVVKNAKFDFNHLTYVSEESYMDTQFIAYFKSETSELTGYSPDGQLRLTNQFNSANNMLKYEGVNPCVCGGVSTQHEGFLYTKWAPSGGGTPSGIAYEAPLFVVTFFERPTEANFFVRFDQAWGGFIPELNSDENHDRPRVGIKVKCGNKWYQDNGNWSTSEPSHPVLNFGQITNAPVGDPIEVHFYDVSNQSLQSQFSQWDIYNLISNVHLETVDAVFSEYRIVNKGYTEIKIGEADGRNIGDIYLGFNAYYKNTNLIGTVILARENWFTNYHYMLYSREQMKLKCRRTNSVLPYYDKCAKVSFAGKTWRLIAISMEPWNDEITVTLQRSLQPN